MANRYWVGGAGNWNDTAHWSASSGGASGASVPTSADDVIFDGNSFSANNEKVTIPTGVTASALSIDWTAVTETGIQLEFATSTSVLDLYGSWTSGSNVKMEDGTQYGTLNFKAPGTFASSVTTHRVNANVNTPNGTDIVELGDVSGFQFGTFTVIKGTFRTNGYDFTPGNFSAVHATNPITIEFGASIIKMSGANVSACFKINNTGNITFDEGTSTIRFFDSRTFNGEGRTFYNIEITPSFSGVLTITGSNTFNQILAGLSGDITFTAGTTQTIGAFVFQGTSGNKTVLRSSSPGTQYTLSKASGTVLGENIDLQDCIGAGGATWVIVYPSTDSGNNTGWTVMGGTPTISGTIVPSAVAADIIAGGKTIIITLVGDTWVASGGTFDAIRQDIIDGLDSTGVGTNGWNNEVRDKQGVAGVVRTSDTVVTITLDAQAAYAITASEVITVTVPDSALAGLGPLVGSPTFSVGTGVGGNGGLLAFFF